jgi:hypothetical protein
MLGILIMDPPERRVSTPAMQTRHIRRGLVALPYA